MRRAFTAVLGAALFSLPAFAVPSDLPWQNYVCQGAKTLAVKFLSDGLSIEVKIGERTAMVSPVDEVREEGFKPGVYKGQGLELTLGPARSMTLTGQAAAGGPYLGCVKKS